MTHKATAKVWKSDPWLKSQGLKYQKLGKPIPMNWPRDFDLTDSSGKVYMELHRGKMVVVVDGTAPSILDELKKVKENIRQAPVDRAVPQNRAAVPLPSQVGPQAVGPGVPLAEVVGPEIYQLVADLENEGPLKDEKHKVNNSDAVANRLHGIFLKAFPNVQIHPIIGWIIAVGIWQIPMIWHYLRTKMGAIKAWFGRLFKRKSKPGEEPEKPPEPAPEAK